MQHLLALPTDALLGKFGSGKHAPGSGSAAALMGLLAAKLVLTVGRMTLLRDTYKDHHADIRSVCDRVENDLVPELEKLFQKDAEVFDAVIASRRSRDAATEPKEKRTLSELALHDLKTATAIPFQIADICLELIDRATVVFDHGFRAARGDTGVAVSSAVAAVLSAVFVINLNLKSFRGSFWARNQRRHCDALQSRVTEKYQSAVARVTRLRTEDIDGDSPTASRDIIAGLLDGAKSSYSRAEIDDRAATVRTLIWRMKGDIWVEVPAPSDPVDMLNPEVALGALGFSFDLSETLGRFKQGSTSYEVAGLLEAQLGQVRISRQMIPTVRRYTAAHELGHIVLHPQLKEAHRDRPLDGSNYPKAQIEREADTFASCYLMPTRLITTRFTGTFGAPPFELSDDTAFALLRLDREAASKVFRTRRDLARALARSNSFNGQQIVPLAEQFGVSLEAMAIRLEELEFVSMEVRPPSPMPAEPRAMRAGRSHSRAPKPL